MIEKDSKSKYALLGLLTLGPMSGYDMRQTIERSLVHFWNEGYGQIYPMLRQLADQDLATVETIAQSGKPDRNVYALTDAGWAALCAWLAEPVAYLHPTRNELLLKLFFGRQVPHAVSAAHVRHYRELQQIGLQRFDAIAAMLRSERAQNPDQPYWLITLSHGQHICRALITWCDETLAMLVTEEMQQ